MRDNVFIFWFFVTVSDGVGAILAAVLLFRLGTRFGRYLGFFMAAVAVEAIIAGASLLLFFPHEASVAPEFAVTRLCARAVKSAGVWGLALYLLNLCQRKRSELHYTKSATRPEGSNDGER